MNAHSLYFENLGEVGVVGLGLLALVVLGSLVAIGRRIRAPERTLYAAAFAAAVVWTIHAGFDWDWQMPAVTLPVFVLAGCALGSADVSRQTGGRRPAATKRAPWRAEPLSRSVLGVVVLLIAVVPALVSVSQRHLDRAVAAFARSDCAAASSDAANALTLLDTRHAAHEVLAYCDAARGQRTAALAEIRAAVHEDPKNWEPEYGLAVVLAADGRDPRAAMLTAKALNRYEPVVKSLGADFRSHGGLQRIIDAQVAPLPVNGQYGTALAVLTHGITGH